MKKILFKIKSAFLAGRAAFLQPDIMVESHFKIMAAIYENILKVQEQNSPLMFQIGVVMPENENHTIATVWVGAGADSSPIKRIEQLYNENAVLKIQLKDVLTKPK